MKSDSLMCLVTEAYCQLRPSLCCPEYLHVVPPDGLGFQLSGVAKVSIFRDRDSGESILTFYDLALGTL